MVITGYEERDLLPAFQGRLFLQKPFLLEDLVAVVTRLWEYIRSRRQGSRVRSLNRLGTLSDTLCRSRKIDVILKT
jgi:hypothetical protein